MKFYYLVAAPFALLPFYTLSYADMVFKNKILQSSENTRTMIYSNESKKIDPLQSVTRSIDYPTQIIRINSNIENQLLTCNEVHEQINKTLVENIATDQFTYSIFISCHYDPNTFLATHFIIQSYFDPINDEAISYLKSYLNEYNGSMLLGTKLKIESAKGLVISLNIAVGMKKNSKKPPFTEYRKDRSNLYFKSNYEMKNKLLTDINQNFYSNDPNIVLPFLDKWLFSHAGSIYRNILRESNYIELEPERIFLMENGEEIFVSGLKQYFMHHCEQYENHFCLKKT